MYLIQDTRRICVCADGVSGCINSHHESNTLTLSRITVRPCTWDASLCGSAHHMWTFHHVGKMKKKNVFAYFNCSKRPGGAAFSLQVRLSEEHSFYFQLRWTMTEEQLRRRPTKTTAAARTILASTLLYALADYMLVVLFSCYVGWPHCREMYSFYKLLTFCSIEESSFMITRGASLFLKG